MNNWQKAQSRSVSKVVDMNRSSQSECVKVKDTLHQLTWPSGHASTALGNAWDSVSTKESSNLNVSKKIADVANRPELRNHSVTRGIIRRINRLEARRVLDRCQVRGRADVLGFCGASKGFQDEVYFRQHVVGPSFHPRKYIRKGFS